MQVIDNLNVLNLFRLKINYKSLPGKVDTDLM
jgi:hypothetical protein